MRKKNKEPEAKDSSKVRHRGMKLGGEEETPDNEGCPKTSWSLQHLTYLQETGRTTTLQLRENNGKFPYLGVINFPKVLIVSIESFPTNFPSQC